ncbi:MAG TPA: hypothetical protein VF678_15150, partial [bacterium]
LKEIKQKPEEFMNRFHAAQMSHALSALPSDNYVRRAAAIRELVINPCLTRDHFENLVSAMREELSPRRFRGLYSIAAIYQLGEAMLRLDTPAALPIFRDEILAHGHHPLKTNGLLMFVATSHAEADRRFILECLDNEVETIRQSALQALITLGGVSDAVLMQVLRRGHCGQIQQVTQAATNGWLHLNPRQVVGGLLAREAISWEILSDIFYFLGLEALLPEEKAALFLRALETTGEFVSPTDFGLRFEGVVSDPRFGLERLLEFLRRVKTLRQNQPFPAYWYDRFPVGVRQEVARHHQEFAQHV